MPKDAFRIGVFLEPLALYVQSLCGRIANLTFAPAARTIDVAFDADDASCVTRRLKLSKTSAARPGRGFAVGGGAKLVRGAYEIAPPRAGAGRAAGPPVARITYEL